MAEAANYVLGFKAGLYMGSAGETSPDAMDYVGNVQDLDIDRQFNEVDITSRSSGGTEETAATTSTMSAKFKMKWLPDDPFFKIMQQAADARTPLAFAVLDQKIDADDSVSPQGPLGDWMITQFSVSQPLKGIITTDITIKVSKYQEWYRG